MWRVVVGGEVSHHNPSTNHNSPHERVIVFFCDTHKLKNENLKRETMDPVKHVIKEKDI